MAKKAKQPSSSPNVTRISANEPKQPKDTVAKPAETKTKTATKATKTTPKPKKAGTEKPNVFVSILGYFTGAWHELRQVRWPNRRSTWGLTGGVILFTGGFVLVIVVLDAVFKNLFDLVLG